MQQRGAGAREADDVQWPGDFHIGQGRIFGKRRLGVETVEQPQHRAIHHEEAPRIELRFVAQRFQENFKRLTKGRAAESDKPVCRCALSSRAFGSRAR